MKIHSFIFISVVLISFAQGFLFPFIKLAPDIHQAVTNKQPDQRTQKPRLTSGLTTFRGMPNPFWFSQTIDASKSQEHSVRPHGHSRQYESTDACSYPCQRVPYYLKFEHALIMNGLEREISSIMTSSVVNAKGMIDVGRCEGSCRKAEAQNIRVCNIPYVGVQQLNGRQTIFH